MTPEQDESVVASERPFLLGEECYRRLFEVESDAVFMIDSVSQRFLDANPTAEKLYGYSREEFLSMMVSDISAEPEKTLQAFAEGAKYVPLRWHRKKEGTVFPVEIAGSYFEYRDHGIHVVAIRDISKQKLSEDLLRESEERYRGLFEHMSEGCAYCRMIFENGRPVDWIYLSVNKIFAELTGIEDAVGKSVLEVIPGLRESDPELFKIYGRVALTGKPEKFEMFVESLQDWFSVSAYSPEKHYFVAVFNNITQKKLAEIEFRKSEIWCRSLIELGVSVYIVVDAERRVKFASPPVKKILGWKAEDLHGKPFFDIVDAADAEPASHFFAELLRSPGRKKRAQVRLRDKGGESKVFEIFGANLFDEPAVQGIVLSAHDVTEQVQSRERVDAFRAELTHASRLASMGELASGIAHEINQPLSIMAAWAEVASREIRDHLQGDKQEALLALMRIDTAIERSGDIIQHVKDFARKSEPHVSKVHLIPVIDEVLTLLEHQLRLSGVVLQYDLAPDTPPVLADRTQVQQVLMNLILNAVEALENTEPLARRVEIRARPAGDVLEISVSDNGCSIDPENVENIFEPFNSTKPQGLGLGLSICRSIIQWHGGRIWATPDDRGGTTFAFTLPIAKEKSKHA